MGTFGAGEAAWTANLGNLRNTIRQDLIGRHLSAHVEPATSVLDVGCGQGTQAIRLMERGCAVTGVEPSKELLHRFRTDATASGLNPELIEGEVDQLDTLLGDRVFDAVCAHGLLMYLDDPAQAIARLAKRVASAGLLSITFKNAHGLAMRPALRGDWTAAVSAFNTSQYVNELGVDARANRLEEIESHLAAAGLEVDTWYGVRVFNDAIAASVDPPSNEVLEQILEAEDLAGRTDPYRWLGSQFHVIAKRPVTPPDNSSS